MVANIKYRGNIRFTLVRPCNIPDNPDLKYDRYNGCVIRKVVELDLDGQNNENIFNYNYYRLECVDVDKYEEYGGDLEDYEYNFYVAVEKEEV